MPVVTVRLDEQLARRLEELAKLRSITRSTLMKEILEEALKRQDDDPVREALRALRQKKKPGFSGDWSQIEKELRRSKPRFNSVEEALAASRRRSNYNMAHFRDKLSLRVATPDQV
jgi:predicted DNA-binding protein